MVAPVFVADELVTAAKMNSLPKGVLGYAQVTANQAGIAATVTDLTGLSVTVTVEAGRRVKITAHAGLNQLTAPGTVTGFVREGSTELGTWVRNTIQTSIRVYADASVVITPTAGSHTYKLSLNSTGGTVTAEASATAPCFILVEDLGGV